MQMLAFLTDKLSIRRMLDHLGLSAPPQDKPPPVREVLRWSAEAFSTFRKTMYSTVAGG